MMERKIGIRLPEKLASVRGAVGSDSEKSSLVSSLLLMISTLTPAVYKNVKRFIFVENNFYRLFAWILF